MKKRWEIEEKDTWRLEDMVESDARWEELFAQAKEEIGGYGRFQGCLGASADTLYECLAFDDALSQKLDADLPFYHRFFLAFGVTDEIFGLSVTQKGRLNPWYTYGIMSVAVPGWSLGTITGILSTGVLPQTFLNAMNMALYGMFIAVFMPAARENRLLRPILAVSMAGSAAFHLLPQFDFLSSGMKIIVLTLAISLGAAALFPIEEAAEKEEKPEAETGGSRV